MTTSGVTALFVKENFVNYGLPWEIICDIVRKFMNEFWKSLFKLYGTKISIISTYHLKADR